MVLARLSMQLRLPLIAGLVAVLASCASNPSALTREYLDTGTGVTVTASQVPLVLYRDNPAAAAYARNMVHLGPIEVNRSGEYRYFLWVGIWNTLQSADTTLSRDGFETIVITVDSESMALDLAGWTPSAIDASAPVYLRPVASASEAYYPLTVDQIRFIAEARSITLRTTGSSPREYNLWSGQQGARQALRAFLDQVGY
jgi:hypothetical protein